MAEEMRSLVCWDNDGHRDCAAPDCLCPCHKAGEGPLMAEPLDLDAILREHQGHETLGGCCRPARVNVPWPTWPCEPYRLASELAEARAALQRVRSLPRSPKAASGREMRSAPKSPKL